MSFPWRSPTARKACNISNSTRSSLPVPIRHSFSDAVPSGTVASRVRFLESSAKSNYPNPRPPSPPRPREHSRTGFGRRITKRFGQPASRNDKPDEQSQVEAEHTYLGLTTPRINHDEEHAIASRRATTCSQTGGLHGPIRPQGLTQRVQYDAASPWSIASRNKPTLGSKRGYSGHEMDVLKEVDSPSNVSHFTAPTSIFPNATNEDLDAPDMYRREVKSRQDGTMKSDISAVTTSTVRRQSVRDIFEYYGIERPAGLVSEEDLYHEKGDTPKPPKPYRRCLSCSWLNPHSANWCSKCKHLLQKSQEATSSFDTTRKKASSSYLRKLTEVKEPSSPETSAKENSRTQQATEQCTPVRTGPALLQKPKEALPQIRKLSSPPTKFPSFNAGQSVHSSSKKVREKTLQKINLLDQTVAPPSLTGIRSTTSVKDSPFLIADLLNHGGSLQLLPVKLRITSNHGNTRPKSLSKGNLRQSTDTVSSYSEFECESPGCRATHNGHQPYRHSVSCFRRKRRLPERTDNGYVADTSLVDDLAPRHSHTHSSQPSVPLSEAPRPDSKVSDRSHNSTKSECSLEDHTSEYVECHGYPRTGHARHERPSMSGAIGQCQHCLDDCKCASCQGTHHSVRCCMHEDHHPLVHHHLSPRTSRIVNPLECPTLSSQGPELHQRSPPASPAHTIDTVIPVASKANSSRPLSFTNPSEVIDQQRLSKKAKLRPVSPPRSKRSTFLKEVSQGPTPPPRILEPKTRTKSLGMAIIYRPLTRPAITDTTSNIAPISASVLPITIKPIIPPPPTCNESSPERDRELTEGTWVTVLSDHEHKLNDMKRTSYGPSRSQSAFQEKHPRLPSAHSLSRIESLSAPDSRIALRRLSALFQLGEKSTVPLLNQTLLGHQDELKKIGKECDKRIEILARENGMSSCSEQFQEAIRKEEEAIHLDRPLSVLSSKASSSTRKKRWGLRLVDRKPAAACPDDEKIQRAKEHRLSDDRCMEKELTQVVPETWVDTRCTKNEEHECIWKIRFLAEQSGRDKEEKVSGIGGMPLKGVTIVVHVEGKEDVVIKADLGTNGRGIVRAGGG